jgi:hypothetical protein
MGVLSLSSNPGYAAWFANPIIVAVWFLYLRDKRLAALSPRQAASGIDLSHPGAGTDADFSMGGGGAAERQAYSGGSDCVRNRLLLWIVSAGILVAGLSADMLLFRLFRGIHARLSAIPTDF